MSVRFEGSVSTGSSGETEPVLLGTPSVFCPLRVANPGLEHWSSHEGHAGVYCFICS